MGRIEELETELAGTDKKIRNSPGCWNNQLAEEMQELLDELDSLQDAGYPENADTNELP